MPYISNYMNARDKLLETLQPTTRGELNFLLYSQALSFVNRVGKNYHTLDDVVTAYEDVIKRLLLNNGGFVLYVTKPPVDLEELSMTMYSIVSNYMSSGHPAPIGTVRLSQAEFIRRVVNPYEDIKIRQNGDVVVGS